MSVFQALQWYIFHLIYKRRYEGENMNLGKNIKKRREEKGLTQNSLSDLLNISRTSISNWETGKNYPDFGLLIEISNILELPLDILIKEDYELHKHIMRTEQKNKLTKIVLAITLPILIICIMFFLISSFSLDISEIKECDIKSASISENNLRIELRLNGFESIESWIQSPDGEKDMMELSISKKFNLTNIFKKDTIKTLDLYVDENTKKILLPYSNEIIPIIDLNKK
jgi:transcriptional regulator with XRE-family HTH domain